MIRGITFRCRPVSSVLIRVLIRLFSCYNFLVWIIPSFKYMCFWLGALQQHKWLVDFAVPVYWCVIFSIIQSSSTQSTHKSCVCFGTVYPKQYVRGFVVLPLAHWGWDKIDAISQTTFSNAFSWMKMLELRLKFHWSLFPRVQLTICQHWFR